MPEKQATTRAGRKTGNPVGRPRTGPDAVLLPYAIRLQPHVISGLAMMEELFDMPDTEIARRLIKDAVDRWHLGGEADWAQIRNILQAETP